MTDARFHTDENADGSLVVVTRAGATLPAVMPGGWRIAQGSTAHLLISLVNADSGHTVWPLATGFTASLTARKNYGDSTALFTATTSSEITLTSNAPNIRIELLPATTAELNFTGGVFDLELAYTATGETMKVLTGRVWLLKEAQ